MFYFLYHVFLGFKAVSFYQNSQQGCQIRGPWAKSSTALHWIWPRKTIISLQLKHFWGGFSAITLLIWDDIKNWINWGGEKEYVINLWFRKCVQNIFQQKLQIFIYLFLYQKSYQINFLWFVILVYIFLQ